MYVLRLECLPAEEDLLIARLWECGTAGIVQGELPAARCSLEAYFTAPPDLAPFAAYRPHLTRAEERDWEALARESWRPLPVGERFFLVPTWSEEPVPAGRLRLEAQAGLACGTGYHPATQLCLEAIEDLLRPEDVFLDLGTGSGILALAAGLLGAGRILACDIDPQAVQIARAALARCGISASLFAGSLRAIRSGSVDLLAANLNAETLCTLAAEIPRVLRAHGRCVLSGFREQDLARLEEPFRAWNAPVTHTARKEGWLALVLDFS